MRERGADVSASGLGSASSVGRMDVFRMRYGNGPPRQRRQASLMLPTLLVYSSFVYFVDEFLKAFHEIHEIDQNKEKARDRSRAL
jgi:hypothetical protein